MKICYNCQDKRMKFDSIVSFEISHVYRRVVPVQIESHTYLLIDFVYSTKRYSFNKMINRFWKKKRTRERERERARNQTYAIDSNVCSKKDNEIE